MAQLNFDFDTATDYNKRHAHHRDSRIVFEPGEHKYIVDGEGVCDSVTQVVTSFFAQFDADYWAARKATPDCPAEKLKAMWAAKGEEARDLGTLLHHRIEEYYLGHEPDCEAANERGYMHFMAFAADHSLTPYRSEWPIFSRRYRIAGTLDFLAHDGEKFEIYDWKRSTKVCDAFSRPLLTNYGKYAFAPISHVPDTTYHHYALQLSFYRYMLATEYDIEVLACHLGVFHPDMASYHLVDVPYLRDEVITILNSRL